MFDDPAGDARARQWAMIGYGLASLALRDCLLIDHRTDDLWHKAWSMEALGWVAVDTGRFERGAQLLGIAEVLWAQSGSRLADPLQAWHATAVERLRERLGAPRLSAEIETGRSFSRADGRSPRMLAANLPARG